MPVSALPAMRAAIAYSAPAAAASGGWWLAGGTISESNVVYHDENVAANTTYSGSTLATNWTWAAKFTVAQPATATAIMDSSTNSSNDYWLRHEDANHSIRFFHPSAITTSATDSFPDGSRVLMLVVDESSNTAKVYVDNVEILSVAAPAAGEFEGGSGGILWAGMYANADYLELINIALDPTQRAALYASMSA